MISFAPGRSRADLLNVHVTDGTLEGGRREAPVAWAWTSCVRSRRGLEGGLVEALRVGRA